MNTSKLTAIFLAVFAITSHAETYVITGSGASFTATKNSATIGTNQPIQSVIRAIGIDANGAASTTIQFGDGSTVLDIGTATITLDTIGPTPSQTIRWGALTLTGKITAASECTISINQAYNDAQNARNISITSTAEIENTRYTAISMSWTSTLTITGGKVSSNGGWAINGGAVTVTISGGEVSATGRDSRAISLGGTLTISGGTISVDGEGSVAIAGGNVTASGGEIKATGTDSYAIDNYYLTLTGTPKVTGTIKTYAGRLTVTAPFTPTFAEGISKYKIIYTDILGNIAVEGGASFMSSFDLPTSFNEVILTHSISGSNITVATTNGYAVAKSGTTYTITRGTGTYITIQQAIDNIRTQANRAASTIQFGNGTDILDIGTSYLYFNGGYGWGALTFTGKITSYSSGGGISISLSNISATSTAEIQSNIYNGGTLNISGGTINGSVYSYHRDVGTSKTTVSGTAKIIATGDYDDAIRIYGDESWTGEAFKMTGGTILAKAGYAVMKSGSAGGTVNITGGTLFAYKKDGVSTVAASVASGVTPGANVTMLAWDKPASDQPAYTAFTSTDIFKSPTATTARWLNKNGAAGIDYANGTNNTGFIELPVTVSKTTPAITTWPTAAAITYGSLLSSSALTGGNSGGVAGAFAWVNPSTKPSVSTTTTYNVQFTPTDAANYNAPEYATAITVTKATGLAAIISHTLMIKNTDVSEKTFPLADIALNKADHGTLTYELDGALTDASGILNGTLSIADGALHYKGNGKTSGTATQKIKITSQNYNDVDATITFKATDKTEVTIAGTAVNSTYNAGTANAGAKSVTANVVGGGVYENGTLVWEYAGTGISSTSTTTPINAGEYVLTVSVPDTDALYFGSKFFPFTIAKAKIAKPAASTATLTYTGIQQTYAIAANAAYTITGNKGTNAGTYTATVALNDKVNYEWADGSNEDLSLPWTIGKATPTPATPTGLTATVGQTLANVPLPTGWAWATPTDLVGAAGTQTHKAKYTPSDLNNYETLTNVNVNVNVTTPPPQYTQSTCTTAGLYWYNNTCNSISQAEANCYEAGKYWYSNKCNTNPQTEQQICQAEKGVWYKDYCYASTADKNEAACYEKDGYYWEDGKCKKESTPILPGTATFSNLVVKAIPNGISIENLPSNAKLEVFNLQGKRVYSAYPENPSILKILVQTGVYVIKTGTQTIKVAVK